MAAAWTKRQKVITGAIAGAALLVGGVVAAINLPVSSNATGLNFEARFDTAADFYNNFDYGYSGQNPFDWYDGSNPRQWQGDHDLACGLPTTQRTVHQLGDGDHLNFSELFWWCAPGNDPTKGHLMTAVNTIDYNIAWFSPKPAFVGIQKVCWDINETTMSRRKWTQVVFVGASDAIKYPVGSAGPPTRSAIGQTRGTGGFDLGYVSPEFSDPNGVGTRIISTNGTQAGIKIETGGSLSWWEGGHFTMHDAATPLGYSNTDKASRYQQCLEQTSPGQIRFSQDTPAGLRTKDFPGTIPQDARRVVFEDDNYNPPKDDASVGGYYRADTLTWHWDNIQVFVAGSPPVTTIPPSATTAAPPTSEPTTATTVASTCPSDFTADQLAWCENVNARLHALDGG